MVSLIAFAVITQRAFFRTIAFFLHPLFRWAFYAFNVFVADGNSDEDLFCFIVFSGQATEALLAKGPLVKYMLKTSLSKKEQKAGTLPEQTYLSPEA